MIFRKEILCSPHLLSVAWSFWGRRCLCLREFIDKTVGRVTQETDTTAESGWLWDVALSLGFSQASLARTPFFHPLYHLNKLCSLSSPWVIAVLSRGAFKVIQRCPRGLQMEGPGIPGITEGHPKEQSTD